MPNEHTEFWLALLHHSQDMDERARLWNGYLGWKLPPEVKGNCESRQDQPHWIVEPPEGGWPELTEEEKETIETLAREHGGHPTFIHAHYMDFSGLTFSGITDLAGLIFYRADFDSAQFEGDVRCSDTTRFCGQTWFHNAIFEGGIFCDKTRFDTEASFAGSCFKRFAMFSGVEFRGGASFAKVVFELGVMFNDSKFEERGFPQWMIFPSLADFKGAKFLGTTSFKEALFGNNDTVRSRRLWPERRADFTDAEFRAPASFRGAVFGGPPAFFNTTLHEDTDFERIDWRKAETKNVRADYAIQAWERLELMMSKLEKPLDRHRFFRLKMRARRRVDGPLLRIMNWLFDKFADYGWGVGRSFKWWFGHWAVSGLVLYANTPSTATAAEGLKLPVAALATGFANAHAFLRLTAEGGYLKPCQKLLEDNDIWSPLTITIGTAEAVFGPVFLFLLLLTLRNRFRLA